MRQSGPAPFNPRNAVAKFCDILHQWGIGSVTGDNYAGSTFAHDFEERDIRYIKSRLDKTEIYESFEPRLNAGEVRLLDVPELIEQLLTLVVRGARIDHEPGGHDDWANAACGVLNLAAGNGDRVTWSLATGVGFWDSSQEVIPDRYRNTPPPKNNIENNSECLRG